MILPTCFRVALSHSLPFLLCAGFAFTTVAQTIPNPSFELNTAPTNFPGYVNGNAAITGWTTNDTARVGLNPGTNFSPFSSDGTNKDYTGQSGRAVIQPQVPGP
jgi:hypothetical protein